MKAPDPSLVWNDAIASRISRRTGFAVRDREIAKLAHAVDRDIREAYGGSVDRYVSALDSAPTESELWQRLLEPILIGETSFFRHARQFDLMRDSVLPGRSNPAVWCAGCASGEEAFSISMVCRDANTRARIWGTDISRRALAEAASGLLAGRKSTIDERARRWLRRDGTGWEVDADVRRAIVWEWVNLVDAETFAQRNGPFDLIMCRNVLIYFEPAAMDRVLALFERSLAPDGWLMLGHAESLLFRETSLHLVAGGLGYTKSAPPKYRRAVDPPAVAEQPRRHTDGGQEVVRRAVSLEQRGHLDEAATLLERALLRDRSNLLARLCLTGILRRAGRVDAAADEIAVLARQLEGLPEDGPVPGGEGMTYGALRAAVAPYAPGGRR